MVSPRETNSFCLLEGKRLRLTVVAMKEWRMEARKQESPDGKVIETCNLNAIPCEHFAVLTSHVTISPCGTPSRFALHVRTSVHTYVTTNVCVCMNAHPVCAVSFPVARLRLDGLETSKKEEKKNNQERGKRTGHCAAG